MTKEIEILVLRRQPALLRRGTPRPRMNGTDRALIAALTRLRPMRRRLGPLITPGMILRWGRQLITRRWTPSPPAVDPPSKPASAPWSTAWPPRNPTPGPPTHPRRARRPRLASTIWNILPPGRSWWPWCDRRCAGHGASPIQPGGAAPYPGGVNGGTDLAAVFYGRRPGRSWHATCSTSTPSPCTGSTPSSPSSTPPASCTSSPSPPTRRSLAHPVGPQPPQGSGTTRRPPLPVRHPRPRRQVHYRLRRRPLRIGLDVIKTSVRAPRPTRSPNASSAASAANSSAESHRHTYPTRAPARFAVADYIETFGVRCRMRRRVAVSIARPRHMPRRSRMIGRPARSRTVAGSRQVP
jgi:hypothetical protein